MDPDEDWIPAFAGMTHKGMKFGGELNRLEHGPCWFPPIAENVLCNLPKLLFLRANRR